MSRSIGGRRVRPGGGFELAAWFFMRISGLVLVLLALGHLVIVHLIYNVETINYAFVADRWSAPGSGFFWRIWDLALINLAVIHGFNGLRQILDEVVVRPTRRVAVHTVLWTVAILFVGVGSYAILMFERDQAYIQAHPRISEPNATVAGRSPGSHAPPAVRRTSAATLRADEPRRGENP